MAIPGLSDSLLLSLGQVRKAYPTISYQGIDVSQTFQPSLVDFVYKEGFGDQQMADTLEITLADPEGLFRKSWSLSTGQTVSASIVVENWNGPGTGTLTKPLGSMFIKSVRISQNKGSGTTVRISCTSINPSIGFRLEKKSRPWNQTTVQAVAAQIATDNQLTLNAPPDAASKQMDRVDQHDHSDAYMLKKICSENDYSYKVVNGVLWIRDRHVVEQSASVGTIVCPSPQTGPGGLNGSGVENWEFIETTEDANYSEADAKYKDPVTGNRVSGTATDPNQTGGGTTTPISPVQTPTAKAVPTLQPNPGPKLVYIYNPHDGAMRSTEGIVTQSITGQGPSLTVPDANKSLPDKQTTKTDPGTETNAAVTEKAKLVALSKLRQKNRKGNEFIITFPILTTLESGTVYSLNGFTPDGDSGQWVLVDCVLSFKGKSGSTTKCTFQKALTF